MADNGLAAVNAFMPQVQNLSFPALAAPTTTSSSGPTAIPRVMTGDDGLPHTVYVDTSNGMVVNNLAGYQVVTANGTVQVPPTTSVPVSTGTVPPAQTTNIVGTHDSSGGGALSAQGGSPSGSGNRGSTNPMNNFGYVDKPGWVGPAAGMLLGPVAGAALNAGWNANNQTAVNTARSMVGLPAESTGQQLGGIVSNNKGQVSNDAIINGQDYSVGFNALSPTGNTNLTPTEAAKRAAMFGGVQEGVIGKNDPALPSHAPTPFSPDGSNPQPYTPDPNQAQPGAPGSPEQPNAPQTAPSPSVGGGPVTPSTPTGPNDMNYNGAYGADTGFGWGGTNNTPAGTSTPAPSVAPSTDQSSPSGSIGFGGMNSPAGVNNTGLDGYGGYASPSGNNNGRGYGAYFSNSGPALGNEPDASTPAVADNSGFVSSDERSSLQDRMGYNPSTYNGPTSIADQQTPDQVSNTVGNSLNPSTHQSIVDGNAAPADYGQGVTQADVNLASSADALGYSTMSEQDKQQMAFAAIGEMSTKDRQNLAVDDPTAQATFGSMVSSMMNRAIGLDQSVNSTLTAKNQYQDLDSAKALAQTQAAWGVYGPAAMANIDAVTQGVMPGVNYGTTHYYDPKTTAQLGYAPPSWSTNNTYNQAIGRTIFDANPNMMNKFSPQALANMSAFDANYGAAGAYQNQSYSPGLGSVSPLGYGPNPNLGNFADPSNDYTGGAYSPALGMNTDYGYGPQGWGNFAGAGDATPTYGGGFGDPNSNGAQRDNQDTSNYGGGWGGFGDSSASSSDNGGWGGGRGTDSAGYGGFGGTSSGSDGNNSGTSTGDNGGTNGSGGSAGSQSRSDGWN